MKDAFLRKARESADVTRALIERDAETLEHCVRAVADRFRAGGRLLTMGNGGSGCDALHAAVEFVHPILEKRRALPAMALNADPVTLTAIGNDTDFALVYAEQIRRFGRADDVVLGISTSGQSPNVIRAVETARAAGLLTVAFCGRDGGRLADLADYAFVAPSFSIHRIQEAHTLLLHLLWDQVHVALGEEDVL